MYECFYCGEKAVIWDGDFTADEYGYDVGGLIHECHCTHCNAQITYFILDDMYAE